MKQTVTLHTIVEKAHLASTMKSGSLDVLATPQMIAWMEQAACMSLELEEGQTSVGIAMNVTHDAPSPLGAEITIQATVTEQKGRIIHYEVKAYQGDTCIGKGEHTRCIVNSEKFLAKVYK